MSEEQEVRHRRGVLYGLAAYGIWGLFPLFWPLVKAAGAVEILAHRVIWSFAVSIILLLVLVGKGWWAQICTKRTLGLLTIAAAAISVNWGLYIWAVNNDHVVEAALGYYINPILSILMGVIFLSERLRRWQWAAVGFAVVAVAILTVTYGRPPLVALGLASSFALYGLLKKQINAGAIVTLTMESALLTLPALGYLIFLQSRGQLTFGHLGWTHDLLLISSGVVTVVPLLFFAAAATRVPLSTMGLLQYSTPTLQFLLGVLYFHEQMATGRWVGFALVWVALIVLSIDGLRRYGAGRRHSSRDMVGRSIETSEMI